MMTTGKYVKNEAGDGWKPVCGKCSLEFEDGEIGNTKNYSEDGIMAVFFTCPECKEESEFYYQPFKPENSR